ncbi:hypothetical protein [Streptomyces sp. AC555_RSS877]|uniref:hypothetical protein n=1 Tax=Streptomyces sp. AC555_RSS877 TaxID=2823688 RepID=UPI0027E3E026|nr:hypothetical protein [Streptomyces sp. AC555_RSS877]
MTSWLRSLRVTGVLIVVSAGVVVSPYGSEWTYGNEGAYAAESSPPASPPGSASASASSASSSSDPASASPSAVEPSRAGSRPGEGRERPGRRFEAEEAERVDTEAAVPEDEGGVTAVPEPPRETAAPPPGHPTRSAKDSAARPAEPGLRIMPLGGGLILVGLGLGLAFVALRVRRTAS